MASGIIWNGRIVQKTIDAGIQRNLTAAALFVVRKVKLSLSSGRPASRPGTPPSRLTGTLSRSITHEVTTSRARVGTNLKYARIHELGGIIRPKTKPFLAFKTESGDFVMTKKVIMPARPYLRPAVYKNRRQIKKLLGRKII